MSWCGGGEIRGHTRLAVAHDQRCSALHLRAGGSWPPSPGFGPLATLIFKLPPTAFRVRPGSHEAPERHLLDPLSRPCLRCAAPESSAAWAVAHLHPHPQGAESGGSSPPSPLLLLRRFGSWRRPDLMAFGAERRQGMPPVQSGCRCSHASSTWRAGQGCWAPLQSSRSRKGVDRPVLRAKGAVRWRSGS